MAAERHRDGWLGSELDREALYWDFGAGATPRDRRADGADCSPATGRRTVAKAHFSHPDLDGDLAEVLARIKTGPGLLIMRGFPVDNTRRRRCRRSIGASAAHFGIGARKAPTATISATSPMSKRRRAATPPTRELNLHTNSAEIVGLLCVRDAKAGGISIYSSSLKMHEIIAREHPEYLPVLERGFRCDRRGEEAPEDDPVTPYRVPVFSTRGGLLSCRYVRGVIDRGAQTLGEPLTQLEEARSPASRRWRCATTCASRSSAAGRGLVHQQLRNPARPHRLRRSGRPGGKAAAVPALAGRPSRRGRCGARCISTRTAPAAWASTRRRDAGRDKTRHTGGDLRGRDVAAGRWSLSRSRRKRSTGSAATRPTAAPSPASSPPRDGPASIRSSSM